MLNIEIDPVQNSALLDHQSAQILKKYSQFVDCLDQVFDLLAPLCSVILISFLNHHHIVRNLLLP